jgi:hypothetical protein
LIIVLCIAFLILKNSKADQPTKKAERQVSGVTIFQLNDNYPMDKHFHGHLFGDTMNIQNLIWSI